MNNELRQRRNSQDNNEQKVEQKEEVVVSSSNDDDYIENDEENHYHPPRCPCIQRVVRYLKTRPGFPIVGCIAAVATFGYQYFDQNSSWNHWNAQHQRGLKSGNSQSAPNWAMHEVLRISGEQLDGKWEISGFSRGERKVDLYWVDPKHGVDNRRYLEIKFDWTGRPQWMFEVNRLKDSREKKKLSNVNYKFPTWRGMEKLEDATIVYVKKVIWYGNSWKEGTQVSLNKFDVSLGGILDKHYLEEQWTVLQVDDSGTVSLELQEKPLIKLQVSKLVRNQGALFVGDIRVGLVMSSHELVTGNETPRSLTTLQNFRVASYGALENELLKGEWTVLNNNEEQTDLKRTKDDVAVKLRLSHQGDEIQTATLYVDADVVGTIDLQGLEIKKNDDGGKTAEHKHKETKPQNDPPQWHEPGLATRNVMRWQQRGCLIM